jgi:glycosyltransferase involved in cell wall biosynthesis
VSVLLAVADGRLGGGTTHVLQLIEALRDALPVELHLLTQSGSPLLAEAGRRGVAGHGLEFFASRLDPRLSVRIRALLHRLRPALVHAHGSRAGLPLSFAVRGARFLYSVHGYHFVGKPALVRRLALLAERRCSARADLTVFVSRYDRDLAERAGILNACRDYAVIPNGVDPTGLPPALSGGHDRRLGFLGRLSAEKNPLLALEVLDRLRADGHRLRVIGDGPLLAVVRQRAAALGLADRVELLGAWPRKEALDALAECDALLMPSLWEGMPMAPLEAMAIGVPVVASAVGGLTEIIDDGRTGFLIPQPDPARYARAVRALGDAATRARIVAAARRVFEERYAWPITRQIYLDLYRRLLDRA